MVPHARSAPVGPALDGGPYEDPSPGAGGGRRAGAHRLRRRPATRQRRRDGARPASPGGDLSGTLTVFAAASLTDVFGELGDQLEADNPGLDVQFNFAGSSALATQLTQGAPADVFASANQEQMTVVTDAGLQAADPRSSPRTCWRSPSRRATRARSPAWPTSPTPTSPWPSARRTCPAARPPPRCSRRPASPPQPDTEEEDVKRGAHQGASSARSTPPWSTPPTSLAAGDEVEGIAFPEAEQAINEYPICRARGGAEPRRRPGLRRPGALRRGAAGAGRAPGSARRTRRERGGTAGGAPAAPARPGRRRHRLPGPAAGRAARPRALVDLGPRARRAGGRPGAAAVAGLGDPGHRLVSLVLGVPIAWVLARSRIRGRGRCSARW